MAWSKTFPYPVPTFAHQRGCSVGASRLSRSSAGATPRGYLAASGRREAPPPASGPIDSPHDESWAADRSRRRFATLNNDRTCRGTDFTLMALTLLRMARPINALFCERASRKGATLSIDRPKETLVWASRSGQCTRWHLRRTRSSASPILRASLKPQAPSLSGGWAVLIAYSLQPIS